MKRYVIYQEEKSIYDFCLNGYYQGDYYTVQGELYGCFDKDIKNAKLYKYRKVAENVINTLYKFSNADPSCCKVIEVECEEKPLVINNHDFSRQYTVRLQCPKCKSYNCNLLEEHVHMHMYETTKEGWLKKREYDTGSIGQINHHYECNDCGYGHSTWDENNDDFIIQEKEV